MFLHLVHYSCLLSHSLCLWSYCSSKILSLITKMSDDSWSWNLLPGSHSGCLCRWLCLCYHIVPLLSLLYWVEKKRVYEVKVQLRKVTGLSWPSIDWSFQDLVRLLRRTQSETVISRSSPVSYLKPLCLPLIGNVMMIISVYLNRLLRKTFVEKVRVKVDLHFWMTQNIWIRRF